jgi:formylglycine-generating enzyme required for sulfatase activity
MLPEGSFERGYTNSEGGPAAETAPATVSAFYLDKYEVTVGRFRQFVAAWSGGSGWTPPEGAGKHSALGGGNGLNAVGGGYEQGWSSADNASISPTDIHLACYSGTWTSTVGGNEDKPINCVNWYEAYAFCIWDGGFLPSEAEWEYAAAGGEDQREYPWGATDPGTANDYAIYGCYYPSGMGPCSGAMNLAPVGFALRGAGLWGQVDLAGNVEEWGLDWYQVPYSDPCADCAYLTATNRRVLRGGNFFEFASSTQVSYRDGSPPTTRSAYYGVRCARGTL